MSLKQAALIMDHLPLLSSGQTLAWWTKRCASFLWWTWKWRVRGEITHKMRIDLGQDEINSRCGRSIDCPFFGSELDGTRPLTANSLSGGDRALCYQADKWLLSSGNSIFWMVVNRFASWHSFTSDCKLGALKWQESNGSIQSTGNPTFLILHLLLLEWFTTCASKQTEMGRAPILGGYNLCKRGV